MGTYIPTRNITIEYFRKEVYGRKLDFVKDAGQRQILTGLLQRTTVTSVHRELIRDLTQGIVQFVEVLPPEDNDEVKSNPPSPAP